MFDLKKTIVRLLYGEGFVVVKKGSPFDKAASDHISERLFEYATDGSQRLDGLPMVDVWKSIDAKHDEVYGNGYVQGYQAAHMELGEALESVNSLKAELEDGIC